MLCYTALTRPNQAETAKKGCLQLQYYFEYTFFVNIGHPVILFAQISNSATTFFCFKFPSLPLPSLSPPFSPPFSPPPSFFFFSPLLPPFSPPHREEPSPASPFSPPFSPPPSFFFFSPLLPPFPPPPHREEPSPALAEPTPETPPCRPALLHKLISFLSHDQP